MVPINVTMMQVEALGAGGFGGSTQGGGGGSGAYERVALSVVPGSTYSIIIGQGNGSNSAGGGFENTYVIDSSGTRVVCAGGGASGGLAGGGAGGTRVISCPPEFVLPAANRLDIDGQPGQIAQVITLLNIAVITSGGAGFASGEITVPGNGGPPVMFGAGAGGTGFQFGFNGYVLISW